MVETASSWDELLSVKVKHGKAGAVKTRWVECVHSTLRVMLSNIDGGRKMVSAAGLSAPV